MNSKFVDYELYLEIKDLKKRIAELEEENTKNLGWISRAVMRGINDIDCGDEIIKLAQSNDLEQQANGIETFLDEIESGLDWDWHMVDACQVFGLMRVKFSELRKQAKQLKE